MTLADYLDWVETGNYSAVLFDGALLQVTYGIEGNLISSHRLAYVPCPFNVDYSLLETEPISDVVRMYAARPVAEDHLLSAAVRFDFDRIAARPGHPASHLTLNSTECRIACHSPVRLGNFADFVFRNFYATLWNYHPYFQEMPRGNWGGRTLTDDEAMRMHLSWGA
jgi:hypothetical protein